MDIPATLQAPLALPRWHDTALRDYWWYRIRWPGLLFVVLAGILAFTRIDVEIAHALYYDAAQQRWIGAGNWLINELIHTGGRWLLRVVALAAIALWIWTLQRPALRNLRRPTAYFIVASLLSVGIVGLLKTLTNVHCPWDLSEFGGTQPYLHLFESRLSSMRPGHCFPAAHASSGYALLALHFVFIERHPRLARACAALAIGVGLLFGIAQQSRGAHFLSHDIWSAFLVWLICLTVYTFGFRASLWVPGSRS